MGFSQLLRISRRWLSSTAVRCRQATETDTRRVRNIGVMAHIDAGKTTTTEHMLYYAGFSHHLGQVDHGDTVMDFMTQERSRGITIQSAAITFRWLDHVIDLIDTPGHVDFTFEVERCLHILDGAVLILDASAGVEAQTLTVNRQAIKWGVPKILYLNKMDKSSADLQNCLCQVRDQLHTVPLLVQLPIGEGRSFRGIIDLIDFGRSGIWDRHEVPDGSRFTRLTSLSDNPDLHAAAIRGRSDLVEAVADLDDTLAEEFLATGDSAQIGAESLTAAIRRLTLQHRAVPVLCGSSFHNVAVQPLLDSICHYLPSPADRPRDFLRALPANSLCAIAFKSMHDRFKGPLTLLRLFSGRLNSDSSVYNLTRRSSQKITKLYRILADELTSIVHADPGRIVAVSGLDRTSTGDVIVQQSDSPPRLVLPHLDPPESVFFCTVEPVSLGEMTALERALELMSREDPSFRHRVDAESGETVLAGMGELHLQIIKDRLMTEHKLKVYMGPLQIAYREGTVTSCESTVRYAKSVDGRSYDITMTMRIQPSENTGRLAGGVTLGAISDYGNLSRRQFATITRALKHASALTSGPLLGYPLAHTEAKLIDFQHRGPLDDIALHAAVDACVRKAMSQLETVLLEPVMNVQVQLSVDRIHDVLKDLTRRRATIHDIDARDDVRTIRATAPLAEMVGYSTAIRTLTSGTASFSMELSHYEQLSKSEQDKVVAKMTGDV